MAVHPRRSASVRSARARQNKRRRLPSFCLGGVNALKAVQHSKHLCLSLSLSLSNSSDPKCFGGISCESALRPYRGWVELRQIGYLSINGVTFSWLSVEILLSRLIHVRVMKCIKMTKIPTFMHVGQTELSQTKMLAPSIQDSRIPPFDVRSAAQAAADGRGVQDGKTGSLKS